MFSLDTLGKVLIGLGVSVLLIIGLMVTLIAGPAQSDGSTSTNWCGGPSLLSPVATTPSRSTATTATPTTPGSADSPCYSPSMYGTAVVTWARSMADALYVAPACGKRRGGPACNDTYYTSAFPHAVIAYGQAWCKPRGDCADWANGTYQCVSFVRGAYSQVYPMALSNDAFLLWATYQNQQGWQEIPSGATDNLAQRFLPEPGDVMVFKDHFVGHVAIVMQVQPPAAGHNGWIVFANANSSSAYDKMPLLPSLLVDTSAWTSTDPHHSNSYIVWGYLRPKAPPATPGSSASPHTQRLRSVRQAAARRLSPSQQNPAGTFASTPVEAWHPSGAYVFPRQESDEARSFIQPERARERAYNGEDGPRARSPTLQRQVSFCLLILLFVCLSA